MGDIQRFAAHYGDEWLAKAKDDRGNTALHMAGGNGHTGEFRERLSSPGRATRR